MLFLWLGAANAMAQLSVSGWMDAGDSQIDKNGFVSLAGIASYQNGLYSANLGYSSYFTEWRERSTNGYKIAVGRENTLGKVNFQSSLFYLRKPVSNQMYEWDLGLMLSKNWSHLQLNLGGHYREIRLKNSARKEFPDTKIVENFNLLYRLSFVHELGTQKWHFGATLTNYDHFLLLQETNPMAHLSSQFEVMQNLHIFSEFWYRSAGFNNIQVHYYGYFFRLGASWTING